MTAYTLDSSKTETQRLWFLDNLRTFIIFLVVLCHAGWVYESSGIGAYFWIVDDPATNNASGLVNVILDLFMMPTLFFISGYLAPASLKHKHTWGFIKSKATRLMIPWVFGVVCLVPFYKIFFLASRGQAQESWTQYFHFSNGMFSQVWLWFLPVLFAFNVIYSLGTKIKVKRPRLSLVWTVVLVGIAGSVYGLIITLCDLRGWTKTVILDFQNERLLTYGLLFLLGIYCFKLNVLSEKPRRKAFYITVNAVAWIPMNVYVIFLLNPLFHPGQFILNRVMDACIQEMSFQLSMLSMVYILVQTFRRYFNRAGQLTQSLNRSAYGVYLVHLVVMGGLAMLLMKTTMPSLAKYAILTIATYGLSVLICVVYQKVCDHIVVLCRDADSMTPVLNAEV